MIRPVSNPALSYVPRATLSLVDSAPTVPTDRFQANGTQPARTSPPSPQSVAHVARTMTERLAASLIPGAGPLAMAVAGTPDVAQASVAKNSHTFTRDRGLAGYQKLLDGRPANGQPGAFARAIERLRTVPGSHWLDAGGGDGLATLQLKDQPGFEAVPTTLVSYETRAVDAPGYRVLKGRFLEDIPDAELPRSALITDVYGPLAYSARPHEVLRKYVGALEEGGEILAFLGSDRDHFGSFDKVATRDGRVVDLAEWLQSIPGLTVDVEKRPIMDDDSVIAEAWVARIVRDPATPLAIPELESLYFREGSQELGQIVPRMMFREVGASNPSPARLEEMRSDARQALAERTRGEGAEQFLDAFRTGSLTNPLLGPLGGLGAGDRWVNVGPVASRVGEDLGHGVAFDGTDHPRPAQWLMEKRASRIHADEVDYATSPEGPRARLITDYQGEMLSSLEPDATLRRYVDALQDGGEIFVYLGLEKGGTGLETQVLTKDGGRLNLRGWLESIPGLHVKSYRGHTVRDGGNRWIHDENVFARIKVDRREEVRIPSLDLLGCGAPTADGVAAPLFRERD